MTFLQNNSDYYNFLIPEHAQFQNQINPATSKYPPTTINEIHQTTFAFPKKKKKKIEETTKLAKILYNNKEFVSDDMEILKTDFFLENSVKSE